MKRLILSVVILGLGLLWGTPFARAGLVGYWSFDSGTQYTDQVSGKAGTPQGSPTIDTTDPKFGSGALSLPGSDWLILSGADFDATLNITGPVTIASWIKTTGTGSHILSAYPGTSPYPGYAFGLASSGEPSYWSGKPGGTWVNGDVAANNGAWRHVVVSVSGTTARFYVDGALDVAKTSEEPTSYTGNRTIGRSTFSSTGQFNGLIDELRVYNQALTPREVYQLMTGQTFAMHSFSVPNSSFENPATGGPGGWSGSVPDWDEQGKLEPNSTGVYYPKVGVGLNLLEPVPDGNQVAICNEGVITSAPLGGLASDTLYIVQAEIGDRSDAPFPGYKIELTAGGTRLGGRYYSYEPGTGHPDEGFSVPQGDAPVPANGHFTTATLYATANNGASPGDPLQIVLGSENSQTLFDDVRMMAVTGAGVGVANYSFEAPSLSDGGSADAIPGWLENDTGDVWSHGVHDPVIPTSVNYVPDGENVAFLKPGGVIWQDTAEPLTAGYEYVLLVEVGDRKDITGFPGYVVELLAGGTTIASDNNVISIPDGGFLTSTVYYKAPAGDPLLGQLLTIRLSNYATSGDNQVLFDNVRLFAFNIPEPSTWLLGLLGMATLIGHGWRKRRAGKEQ